MFDLDSIDDTPDVVVDLDRLRANIERAAQLARDSGVALRPHAKTHKMAEVAHMQIDAGATGLQVAKLGEAEALAEAGIRDLFIGYPLVGARKLERLRAVDAELSVAVDSVEAARALSGAGRPLRVLIEIDTGLRRTGVLPGEAAVALARELLELPILELVGVFTHEGHVYAAADKERVAREVCVAMVQTAEAIRALGVELPVVSVGSTVSFRYTAGQPGITELRPGTYVFNDSTQVAQGAATWENVAAHVVATVVSRPAKDRAVIDAGSKVLAYDPLAGSGTHGAIVGRDGLHVTRLSEEHGVIDGASDLRVGDRVAIVPNHICPVINLADSVCVVENGAPVDRWQVAARGRAR
jgi:D-serine deaminase-like pyridoxal phosphate-dependent protein